MSIKPVTLTITLPIDMEAWNATHYRLHNASPERIAVQLAEELTTGMFVAGLISSRGQDEALAPLYAARTA